MANRTLENRFKNILDRYGGSSGFGNNNNNNNGGGFGGNSLYIKEMRVFECDGDVGHKRFYSDIYYQNETRFMCIQCFFDPLTQPTEFDLHWRIYNSDGSPFIDEQLKHYSCAAKTANVSIGRGWDNPGHFKPGNYYFTAWINNSQPIKKNFTIVPGAYGVVRFVNTVLLFEGGDQTPAIKDRQYTDVFDQRTLRRVYFEWNFDKVNAEMVSQMQYTVWMPDGSLDGDRAVEVSLHPGNNCCCTGWGYSQPGRWQPGTYRYQVNLLGSNVISGEFTVR